MAASAKTLLVGPGQAYSKPCAAIAAASAGDTIQVDAAGSYAGDVCAWSTNGLTIRGVNGRPHIAAAGNNAQGKAIWVIAGDNTTIDNVELSGCTVPDGNGAGIRQEGHGLTLLDSYIHDNQDGILAGDLSGSTIDIEYTEFFNNGAGDGQTHNVYINHVDTLIFKYNWSHHAVIGHLLKSRARQNIVMYNRLTGEAGGTESYEASFPSGGLTYFIGNIVEQPATTDNSAMLDYLSEPATANANNQLFVINNTFVNDLGHGTFMQIGSATTVPVVATNNIFYGGGTLGTQASTVFTSNYSGGSPMFANPANYDYRLLPGSPAIDQGVDPGSGAGLALTPTQEYVQPASGMPRPVQGRLDIGAYEFYDTIFANGFEAN